MKTIIGIVAIVALLLVTTFVIHRINLSSEADKIEDYGQKIKVFDGTMNTTMDGHGADTIVLLTGFGTASPRLDFEPLIRELDKKYTVITIEPFGYGLSSGTNRERSLNNMAEEINEVVKQLNLDHFILMGHSIAGLYSLAYINKYPGKATAFVGIDTSVPTQPWPGYNSAPLDFLAKAGVVRAILKFSGNEKPKDESEAHRLEQEHMITMKVTGNKTLNREATSLSASFKDAQKLAFPKDLPVLLFADENSPVKGWTELHQEQANSVDKGKLILLPGSHYLHHTQSKRIVAELESFLRKQNN
ncbi:alpha/beta fold hydrolase [Sphingobacterium tabacisoli]|uniref:alpha/beta fold hydrolase n=1 Tax=Sphingobacterium tabacisoli TaxID=2044855 RepID=UPI001AED7328|nr:alpha/beta hydrolase [Sphingobacterium tabacisoli]